MKRTARHAIIFAALVVLAVIFFVTTVNNHPINKVHLTRKNIIINFATSVTIYINGRPVYTEKDPLTVYGVLWLSEFFGHPGPFGGGRAEWGICFYGFNNTYGFCLDNMHVTYTDTMVEWSAWGIAYDNYTADWVELELDNIPVMSAPAQITITQGSNVTAVFTLYLPSALNTIPLAMLIASYAPNATYARIDVCGEEVRPLLGLVLNDVYAYVEYQGGYGINGYHYWEGGNITTAFIMIPSLSLTHSCTAEITYSGYEIYYGSIGPGEALVIGFSGGHFDEHVFIQTGYALGGPLLDWRYNLLKAVAYIFTGNETFLSGMTCGNVSFTPPLLLTIGQPTTPTPTIPSFLINVSYSISLTNATPWPYIAEVMENGEETAYYAVGKLYHQPVQFLVVDDNIILAAVEVPLGVYDAVSFMLPRQSQILTQPSTYVYCPLFYAAGMPLYSGVGVSPGFVMFEVFGANATGLAGLLNNMTYYERLLGAQEIFPSPGTKPVYIVTYRVDADSYTPVVTNVYINYTEGVAVVEYRFNATNARSFEVIANYGTERYTLVYRPLYGKTGMFTIRVEVKVAG